MPDAGAMVSLASEPAEDDFELCDAREVLQLRFGGPCSDDDDIELCAVCDGSRRLLRDPCPLCVHDTAPAAAPDFQGAQPEAESPPAADRFGGAGMGELDLPTPTEKYVRFSEAHAAAPDFPGAQPEAESPPAADRFGGDGMGELDLPMPMEKHVRFSEEPAAPRACPDRFGGAGVQELDLPTHVVEYGEDWADCLASVLGSFGFTVHDAEDYGVRCFAPSGEEVLIIDVGLRDFPLRVQFPAHARPLAELGCCPEDSFGAEEDRAMRYYEGLYDLPPGTATLSRLENSSAGVSGWVRAADAAAAAVVEDRARPLAEPGCGSEALFRTEEDRALRFYEGLYDLPPGTAKLSRLERSSAGLSGWVRAADAEAVAFVKEMHVQGNLSWVFYKGRAVDLDDRCDTARIPTFVLQRLRLEAQELRRSADPFQETDELELCMALASSEKSAQGEAAEALELERYPWGGSSPREKPCLPQLEDSDAQEDYDSCFEDYEPSSKSDSSREDEDSSTEGEEEHEAGSAVECGEEREVQEEVSGTRAASPASVASQDSDLTVTSDCGSWDVIRTGRPGSPCSEGSWVVTHG